MNQFNLINIKIYLNFCQKFLYYICNQTINYMDYTKEIWKEVPQSLYYLGFKPIYEASNYGRIRNKKTNKILTYTPTNGNTNRLKVQFRNKLNGGLSFGVSHVIYTTFVGDCYDIQVKFKDGNCHNFNVNNLYI